MWELVYCSNYTEDDIITCETKNYVIENKNTLKKNISKILCVKLDDSYESIEPTFEYVSELKLYNNEPDAFPVVFNFYKKNYDLYKKILLDSNDFENELYKLNLVESNDFLHMDRVLGTEKSKYNYSWITVKKLKVD